MNWNQMVESKPLNGDLVPAWLENLMLHATALPIRATGAIPWFDMQEAFQFYPNSPQRLILIKGNVAEFEARIACLKDVQLINAGEVQANGSNAALAGSIRFLFS